MRKSALLLFAFAWPVFAAACRPAEPLGLETPALPAAVTLPPTWTAVPPTAPPASETPAETATTGLDAPTAAPASPSPTPDWLLVESRTALYQPSLGNPEAPVVLTDYSDFL